jgi:hypothetical protein
MCTVVRITIHHNGDFEHDLGIQTRNEPSLELSSGPCHTILHRDHVKLLAHSTRKNTMSYGDDSVHERTRFLDEDECKRSTGHGVLFLTAFKLPNRMQF